MALYVPMEHELKIILKYSWGMAIVTIEDSYKIQLCLCCSRNEEWFAFNEQCHRVNETVEESLNAYVITNIYYFGLMKFPFC